MNISNIKKLGKNRGLTLLSTELLKKNTKYLWLCKNNHKCHATEQQVKVGFQCKKCRNFISEEKVRFIFEQLTKKKFIKTRKVLNGRLELDDDKLKIAFEYNGVQHYYPHPLWHRRGNSLQDQQKRDLHKSKLCKSKGISKLDVNFKSIQDLDNLVILIKNFLLNNNISSNPIINWNNDKRGDNCYLLAF